MTTAPARIERALTLGILRGDYPAGTRLPTVRELAATFDVNQATIQRVIARLETRGLVTARQGSGLAVNETSAGELTLLPYWIEATLDEPAQATKLLEGVLEVRRIIAVRLLVQHRDRLLQILAGMAAEATSIVAGARAGTEAFRAADLAMTRRLLVALGNPIALAVFNTVARTLDQVPLVAEAMYGAPQENMASWLRVMTAIRAGGPDLAEVVDRSMAEVDRASVDRFERLLAARGRAS
jgi:DNA-binding FadR family transcriptional regulator